MPEIRGSYKQMQRRQEYIKAIRMQYGIIIEEFRLKDGQKCGYFHLRFPIFIKEQAPGDAPVGFTPTVTEYTEWIMKSVVNKVLQDEWYKKMCEEWCNSHPVIGENIWED